MIASPEMIKCTLRQVAEAKGYGNAKKLTDAMNEYFHIRMSASALYPYWQDTVQNFSRLTMNRLCAFLDVPPGVLLQYIDEDAIRRDRRRS
jgi:DNA-binding Xre family transcriptional regulator